jgi:anti-sigma regulatory factor (Ser/Thr protein kinase)
MGWSLGPLLRVVEPAAAAPVSGAGREREGPVTEVRRVSVCRAEAVDLVDEAGVRLMSDPVRQRFEASPGAVREARAFLQSAMAGRVDPEIERELTVVLSELASNAVRHAQTPFEVVVTTNGQVRIEVQDGSTEAPVPKAPSGEGGWGLVVVDRICDRWGVDISDEQKCVWCERDMPVVAQATATEDASGSYSGPP